MDLEIIPILIGAVIVVVWTNRRKIADIIRECHRAWNDK